MDKLQQRYIVEWLNGWLHNQHCMCVQNDCVSMAGCIMIVYHSATLQNPGTAPWLAVVEIAETLHTARALVNNTAVRRVYLLWSVRERQMYE